MKFSELGSDMVQRRFKNANTDPTEGVGRLESYGIRDKKICKGTLNRPGERL